MIKVTGDKVVRCSNCNRILKDKKSVERGIGPVCWRKSMEVGSEMTPGGQNGAQNEPEPDLGATGQGMGAE